MRPRQRPTRRVGPLLAPLCGALLACAAGCEEPDDSIRGAGSIHLRAEDLPFRPSPAEPEGLPQVTPGP